MFIKEEIYVTKSFNTYCGIDLEKFKRIMNEYEILNILNHPSIIKKYGFYNGDKDYKYDDFDGIFNCMMKFDYWGKKL